MWHTPCLCRSWAMCLTPLHCDTFRNCGVCIDNSMRCNNSMNMWRHACTHHLFTCVLSNWYIVVYLIEHTKLSSTRLDFLFYFGHSFIVNPTLHAFMCNKRFWVLCITIIWALYSIHLHPSGAHVFNILQTTCGTDTKKIKECSGWAQTLRSKKPPHYTRSKMWWLFGTHSGGGFFANTLVLLFHLFDYVFHWFVQRIVVALMLIIVCCCRHPSGIGWTSTRNSWLSICTWHTRICSR